MQLAKSKKEVQLSFPELPEYEAIWMPVYWEPILLSGERLCAIIAALGHNGDVMVQPVLRTSILKTLYPRKDSEALSLLHWVADSLKSHLVSAGDFADWNAPMSGFFSGELYSSVSDSLEGIFLQALPMSSSLSNADILSNSNPSKAIEMSQERWRATIRDQVVTRIPRLENSFNRPFSVVKGARETSIDFVGQRLASNFSRLISSQLSRCVKDSKAQILDLVALRDRLDLFPGDEQYQLLVWRPDEFSGLSDAQHKTIEEAFLELQGEGDRFDLRVKGYSAPAIAAEDICRIEVAA